MKQQFHLGRYLKIDNPLFFFSSFLDPLLWLRMDVLSAWGRYDRNLGYKRDKSISD